MKKILFGVFAVAVSLSSAMAQPGSQYCIAVTQNRIEWAQIGLMACQACGLARAVGDSSALATASASYREAAQVYRVQYDDCVRNQCGVTAPYCGLPELGACHSCN